MENNQISSRFLWFQTCPKQKTLVPFQPINHASHSWKVSGKSTRVLFGEAVIRNNMPLHGDRKRSEMLYRPYPKRFIGQKPADRMWRVHHQSPANPRDRNALSPLSLSWSPATHRVILPVCWRPIVRTQIKSRFPWWNAFFKAFLRGPARVHFKHGPFKYIRALKPRFAWKPRPGTIPPAPSTDPSRPTGILANAPMMVWRVSVCR